jgi:tagatose 6-phosphate kinase
VIAVVCLNPALDITHQLPAVDWSGVNRPAAVLARPGGKGLNVARTLHALGADVLVLALAGGITGTGVAAALRELAVPATFTAISGETRRTFTVVDTGAGRCAAFNEPGPHVAAAEFAELALRYEEALARCTVVVLSGSLPPGLPAGSYARLIELAAAAGVPVVLDAHGAALLRGAAARPAIAKPNLAELATLTGRRLTAGGGPDWAAVTLAARELQAAGAAAVVASLGPAGLLAVTPDGIWRAVPPATAAPNPTGAGDAVAAGLAHGLATGRPWAERLRHAVALGTACAAAPVAGEFSPAAYTDLLPQVTVRRDGRRPG